MLLVRFLEIQMACDTDFSPEPSAEDGIISFKNIFTFFNVPNTGSPSTKRVRYDGGESTASNRVSLHVYPLLQLITQSRIPLTIVRGSR
jgi:hypothetical protein